MADYVSDTLIFGADGAEEAYAFNTRDMSVVKLPFIGMGHIANEQVQLIFMIF